MSRIARVVHTPGEQPPAAPLAEPPAQDDPVRADAELVATPEGNKGPAMTDEALEADNERLRAELDNARMRKELAELRAQEAADEAKAKADAAQTAADRAAMSEKLTSNKPTAGLRAVDVDPTKIKRAVLTLDGWVCPTEAPQYNARR